MRWIDAARTVLDRIAETQEHEIERAGALCAEAIASGGLVHLFGTGHSRIPVEEMYHTEVVGANGQRQAMFIERVEGLAGQILANFEIAATDVMVVFSACGVTAVPIEMAMLCREQGTPVVAVTSVEASRASETLHSSGSRLLDHADVVIDLCTPAGDALCALEGRDTPVGPGSTLAAVAIVNELKVRTAERLVARDALPPVLTSAALVGADESRRLFDAAYAEHARRTARALRGARA